MTNYEEIEEQLIETVDDEGNIVNFELIDIVEVDNQEYGLLFPKDDKKEDDSEDSEVVLMRLTKEGEEYIFEMIEDDAEFNKVVEFIDAMEDTSES